MKVIFLPFFFFVKVIFLNAHKATIPFLFEMLASIFVFGHHLVCSTQKQHLQQLVFRYLRAAMLDILLQIASKQSMVWKLQIIVVFREANPKVMKSYLFGRSGILRLRKIWVVLDPFNPTAVQLRNLNRKKQAHNHIILWFTGNYENWFTLIVMKFEPYVPQKVSNFCWTI